MPIKYLNRNNTGQANPAGPGSWTTGFNYALNNYAISYGNGYFVATGDGFIARSSNANTWEYKINTSSGVRGVAYGNGLWVAVTGGSGNTGVLYTSSNDGVSWTNLYQPANNYRRGVAYGNSVWVIICESRSSDKRIFTSTDGSTWTARDSDVIYNSFGVTNTISFGGGTFVLVCSSGSSGNTTLCFTSSDGINWTERTLPASTSWKSSAYGNGVWVAVGSGHAARSTDNGATWSSISGRSGTGVTYGDGYFVIAGDSPAYSTDGINWTTISSGPPANSNLTNHIAYGNGIFASVKDTSSSNISTSPMSYIYSQVSPIKFINRNNSGTPVPTGNSVQFNGSNQYLSLPNTSVLNLGSNNFTMEAFVYIPNVSGNKNIFYINGNASSYAAMCLYVQDSRFAFLANQTGGYPWTLQIGAVGPTISSNTWYHIAATRSGNSFYVFVNGTLVSGAPYSLSGALYNGTTNIIGYQPTVSSYFNGYITNARIINGTALYTASFTAPTAPLTAIANTSLLTCNSATIVDNSSNNLTITNNNSATVSSTTPFTVAPATSAVKMRKVYSDAGISIITSGLVLNLDASNASSYPGSGTSWFDLSGNGNTGTLTNGPTFNSANGGSIVFDGTNDYISIGSQNIVGTGTSAFTGELWWYIDKTLASGEYIMPIRIKQDTEFFVGLSNSSGTYNITPTFRLSTQYGIPVTNSDYINKWICMQFVYTGGNKSTASSYKIYINGAQIAVGSNNYGPAGGEGSNCNIIGADGNSGCNVTNGYMKGNIASYRLYTGELTAAQLLQNYNANKAKFGL